MEIMCLLNDTGYRLMCHIESCLHKYIYIVTCLTEGHRYHATLLSLLGNRGRVVPWIRSPLGIVALHGNQQ
jgi:hypothetical protein